MRTHRRVVTSVVLVLFMGMMATLGGGGAPAHAASASVTIPITGTVTAFSDTITLVGLANINSTLLQGAAVTQAGVDLTIFIFTAGGTGLRGTKYAFIGEVKRVRLLNSADQVDITFPIYPIVPGGINLARSALVSFALGFDAAGQLTIAKGKIATPVFPE
jgi:hypothetical protein